MSSTIEEKAVDRVAAAVAGALDVGFPFTVTARAGNDIRGNPDLADTIARLEAYAEAGADVLYARGSRVWKTFACFCDTFAKPVNALARADLTFRELVDAGVQRVSVGGSLTWAAVRGLVETATAIRDRGDSRCRVPSPPEDWLEPA